MARHRTTIRLGCALLCAAGLAVVPAAVSTAGAAPHRLIPGSPHGYTDHMFYEPGGMRFVGWAYDPDSRKTALTVYVDVDGTKIGQVTADQPRPDVAKAHPNAGPNHGFDTFMRIPEGSHRICVWARNIDRGYALEMRCEQRTLDYGPVGQVDKLKPADGAIHVAGWTYDRDDPTAPVTVDITVDSTTTTVVADKPNQQAVAYNPHVQPGPDHGFHLAIPVSQGAHSVCVTAVDIGFGKNNSLGCKNLVLDESPHGAIDTLGQQDGALRVRGWAYDVDDRPKPLSVVITIDGTAHTVLANESRPDVAAAHPSAGADHGFDKSYQLPEGKHSVCVVAKNISFGRDLRLACKTVTLDFTPTAALTGLKATATGFEATGWTSDPDTSKPISARISVDGHTVKTVTANQAAGSHSGHAFTVDLPSTSGKRTVCVVGLNVRFGTHNSKKSCQTITLALGPLGKFESIARAAGSNDLQLTGWAFDPDTKSPLTIAVTVDGTAVSPVKTSLARPDLVKTYPMTSGMHPGLQVVIAATDGEHTVCLIAKNVGGGANRNLGCKLIIAVHPVAPGVPQGVTAVAGYGGATVTWQPPASDGGAPWTKYVITARPGTQSITVPADSTSATITGLAPKTTYEFAVRAYNVAGYSATALTAQVRTEASPPPQRTPAPVSTSRYIRNIRSSTPTERSVMHREGASDAAANPSGHGYLVLLDIGGQDDYDGGVVLSATTHFVTYGDLVKDVESYVDGYHSAQKSSAPITIALGTNNDMQVSRTTGASWANHVVDPVVKYASKYAGMTIAGANDIEPGFRATYTETKAWLQGYLGATQAPFVFNGSADGCAWTRTGAGCNNGWTMSGLYYLAAGAAPIRMLNLPQIYNTTMSAQWKYISLTGVVSGKPRIDFVGTLTEWTACDQTNSCGSMTGHSAWTTMWNNLQSDPRLKVGSLPYSTDLRVDS